MTRWFAPGLALLLLVPPCALAQGASAPPVAAGSLSPQQAQQALAVLQNDAKRAEMISMLEAIAHAAPTTATTSPTAATPTTPPHAATPTLAVPGPAATPATKLAIPQLAPDSLGALLLVRASGWLARLSSGLVDAVRALTNFTLLSRWVTSVATDPDSRAEIQDAAWKLAVVAVVALSFEWVFRRLLARPARALVHAAPATGAPIPDGKRRRRAAAMLLLRRMPFVLGRLLLDLAPLVLVASIGYGLLGTKIGAQSTTRLVILALLHAYLACKVATALTRAVVSPETPALRLVHVGDVGAAYILRWVRRIAVVALFGYAATEVALLFGLYRVAHDALLKLVALVVHVMLLLIVVQKRAAVRRAIRAPEGAHGLLASLRNWVAPVWHYVAIFYIAALWVVWALDVPGGFSRLVEVFVSTAIIVNLARWLTVLAIAAVEHLVTLDRPTAQRYPGLDHLGRRYLPGLRAVIGGAMALIAAVALLEAWGLDSFSWFDTGNLGGRVVSAMVSILFTVLLALLVWEASNAAVQNHLARLNRESQAARSARLRTLLPMLRTALLVAIVLFAGLTILSQIGVNIAPLLAGAGVVGIAIGFGSQKLVQDIITGLFLLLENTMQVGDVVTLGGLTGTVENLSIRTIRLRALDGSVHMVPFSAVTTVTNMTRDFAYALLDVAVGLNEEPDRIVQVVTAVAEQMRHESRWDAAISDSLEVMGVERFIDTAWVLRLRIKTVPSQRWAVSRELNKRIKAAFDAQAIESPFTSYKALAAPLPPPPNAKTPDEAQVAS